MEVQDPEIEEGEEVIFEHKEMQNEEVPENDDNQEQENYEEGVDDNEENVVEYINEDIQNQEEQVQEENQNEGNKEFPESKNPAQNQKDEAEVNGEIIINDMQVTKTKGDDLKVQKVDDPNIQIEKGENLPPQGHLVKDENGNYYWEYTEDFLISQKDKQKSTEQYVAQKPLEGDEECCCYTNKLCEIINNFRDRYHHFRDGVGSFGTHYKTQIFKIQRGEEGIVKKRTNYVLFQSKGTSSPIQNENEDVKNKESGRKITKKKEIKHKVKKKSQEEDKYEKESDISSSHREKVNEEITETREEKKINGGKITKYTKTKKVTKVSKKVTGYKKPKTIEKKK